MAGMALLGAVVYTFGVFTTTSVEVRRKDLKENDLRNMVARNVERLANEINDNNGGVVVTSKEARREALITSVDQLAIGYDDAENGGELGTGEGPFGMPKDTPYEGGVLRVRIYDLKYDVTKFTSEESDDLPPSFYDYSTTDPLDPAEKPDLGFYLVRATFIPNSEDVLDGSARSKRIDTVVVF